MTIKVSDLLLTASFEFRTLEEAHILARFLADTCPNVPLAMLGISELLLNAVEHGNWGISSEEKSRLQAADQWLAEIQRRALAKEYAVKTVQVHWERLANQIILRVKDEGEGFDWKAYETAHAATIQNGRGILMARKLVFEDLTFSEKGNEVRAVIALGPRDQSHD